MRRALFTIAALMLCAPAVAQVMPDTDVPQPKIVGGRLGKAYRPLMDELRRGGLVLLFRHDRTEVTGLWDYEPYQAGRCDRERRLSDAGRASATAIGQAMRLLRVPVTRVVTSTYCRAIETGAGMFGGVHAAVPDLIGPDGKSRTLDQVRRDIDALIARERDRKGVLVLVGHHGSTDAYTTRMLDEGDALVIRPSPDGVNRVIAHIPAARWEEIARDVDREGVEARTVR